MGRRVAGIGFTVAFAAGAVALLLVLGATPSPTAALERGVVRSTTDAPPVPAEERAGSTPPSREHADAEPTTLTDEADGAEGVAPVDLPLVVRVLDATPGHRPAVVDGALVEVLGSEADGDPRVVLATGRTGADGRVRVDVPRGRRARIVASAEGFSTWSASVGLEPRLGRSERTEVLHLLRLGPPVVGRILGPDGLPVTGALVVLESGHGSGGRSAGSRSRRNGSRHAAPFTRTDARGAFELGSIEGIEETAVRVCPGSPDLPPVARFELDGVSGTVHELIIHAGAPVTIHALDAEGAPAAGLVHVDSGSVGFDLRSDPVVGHLVGDREMRAVMRSRTTLNLVLPPGGYTARLYPDAGAPAATFLSVADRLPVVCELRAGRGAR